MISEYRKNYIKKWKEENKARCRSHFRKWYEKGGKEKLWEERQKNSSRYLSNLRRTELKFPEKRAARVALRKAVKYGEIKNYRALSVGTPRAMVITTTTQNP